MINIDKAKMAFKEYLKAYNVSDDKIKLKIIHTYGVVDATNYITSKLKLDEESCNLAKIIAILHDIGRFEQLKRYNDYHDSAEFNHGTFGCKVLFEEGLIRDFIEEDKYDYIIKKAIENHNKYKIEDGLDEKTELFAKIIRDADKLDNFRVKKVESMETLLNISEEQIGEEEISKDVYDEFLEHKLVDRKKCKNEIDEWISFMAFIYDLNFWPSYLFIKENDYVNSNFNRIFYTNIDTKEKIKILKADANRFIFEKLEENEKELN